MTFTFPPTTLPRFKPLFTSQPTLYVLPSLSSPSIAIYAAQIFLDVCLFTGVWSTPGAILLEETYLFFSNNYQLPVMPWLG